MMREQFPGDIGYKMAGAAAGFALLAAGCTAETDDIPTDIGVEVIETAEADEPRPEVVEEHEQQETGSEFEGTWENPIPVGETAKVGAWELTFSELVTEIDGKSVNKILVDLGYLPYTGGITFARAFIEAKLVGDDKWDSEEYDESDDDVKLILHGLDVDLAGERGLSSGIHSMTDNLSDDSLHQQWPLDSLQIGDTIKGHVTVSVHDETVETARWAVVATRFDEDSPDANDFGFVKAEPIYFATVEGQDEPMQDQEAQPVPETAEVAGWRVGLSGDVVTGDAVIGMLDEAYEGDMHAMAEQEYPGFRWVAAQVRAENVGSEQGSLDYAAFTQFVSGSETVAFPEFQVVKQRDGSFVSLFEFEASPEFNPDDYEVYYVGAIPESDFDNNIALKIFDQSSDHAEVLSLSLNN